MHVTRDYTNSPAKAFDAVQDIKEWLGDRWDIISLEMAKVTDVDQFMLLAGLVGVRGYPVRAWYDLYHGEGSFAKGFQL